MLRIFHSVQDKGNLAGVHLGMFQDHPQNEHLHQACLLGLVEQNSTLKSFSPWERRSAQT